MNALRLSLIAAIAFAPLSAFAFEGSHNGAPNWPATTLIPVEGIADMSIGMREPMFSPGPELGMSGVVLPAQGANRPVQTVNSLPLGAAG